MARKMTKSQKRKLTSWIVTLLLAAILLTGYLLRDKIPFLKDLFGGNEPPYQHITLDEVPDYSGDAYVVINSNEPFFTEEEITTTSFEFYSELDSWGRCGYAFACIGTDIQPAQGEERGDIGDVYPSGWNNKRYDSDLVDGGWIYNRSHLIGWQLTAENDNEKKLLSVYCASKGYELTEDGELYKLTESPDIVPTIPGMAPDAKDLTVTKYFIYNPEEVEDKDSVVYDYVGQDPFNKNNQKYYKPLLDELCQKIRSIKGKESNYFKLL